jgi:conjugative relaxase-like TrwC/TraI family protein
MDSGQAASYHAEEQNYYAGETGKWFGKTAENLGLDDFKFKDFERLCHGIDPGSDKVLVDTSKRAGTDLTFSAPKSVSVLCELLDHESNQEIRNAHDRAVVDTLKYIEENYIQTRLQKDNVREAVTTDNMLAALFQHDTSRELDPQIHTHAFVMNLTQREDGNFRALHNEKLFDNKILLGQIYRNNLAQNLKELNYTIEVTNAKLGFFEVKGVSKELLSEFSTRAEQTRQKFEELKKQYPNMEDSKLKEMAALESRKTKDKTVNRKEVKAENIARAQGIENISILQSSIKQQENLKTKLPADKILQRAIEIKSDRESVFSKEELLKEALKLGLGNYGLRDFLKEIENSPELVNLENNLYSTKEMINIEKSILEDIRNFSGKLEAVSDFQATSDFIKNESMTKGQMEAFNFILNNKDLVSAIQGDAGVGKTYLLSQVNRYINQLESENKPELIGLAYTGKAASEIEKEAGISSSTLHSFLNQKEFRNNQIYLVDEASMIGSRQMSEIIEKAKETNSKIVLIGDIKQFHTLQAGSIFQQLQSKNVVQTCLMEESLRAKTQEMRQLYKAVKEEFLDVAFDILEKNESLKESTDLEKIAKEYLEDRKNTLLIASKNSVKNELNSIIRNELKSELTGEKEFHVRESTNLNETEKHFANYYKESQLIFVQKAISGLSAGSEASILKVDVAKNTILVKAKDKEIEIDLSKNGEKLQIFDLKLKPFAIGEQIIFTKNDKRLGLKNGEIATIQDIKGYQITLLKGKQEVVINRKTYNYLDYGYAITDIKSQGQTSEKVLAVADSSMSNLNSFYVQITRAKNSVKIFTDSLQKFKENTMQHTIKSSTLDYNQNQEELEKEQEKEKKSFYETIKKGHELYEKAQDLKEYADLIKNSDDLELLHDMKNVHGMKDMTINTLDKYKVFIKEVMAETMESGGQIQFDDLLKSALKISQSFVSELKHTQNLEQAM